MKLEIEIKIGKQVSYSNQIVLNQKKEIEVEEITCVKTARNAIERVVEEFLIDLKGIQAKAESALEAEQAAAKAKKSESF